MKAGKFFRRIAVGDVHGDLQALEAILRHSKLIDGRGKWTGGDAILIQTGDVIDRGPHSVECIELLRNLQDRARDGGGQVIRLCGNHELWVLQGEYFFTEQSGIREPEKLAESFRSDVIDGRLLASYTDGVRLYTHAGLRSDIRRKLEREMGAKPSAPRQYSVPLEDLSAHINAVFKAHAEKGVFDGHPIFQVDEERGGTDDIGGIFWASFAMIQTSREAWLVPQIFGHSPSYDNRVRCAGNLKLINIDTGITESQGGHWVYLEIPPSEDTRPIQHAQHNGPWKSDVLNVRV